LSQGFNLPLPGFFEFGEAEAGLGFAFAGEKLLHQPFFVGLERVQFPRLRGDQLVHRTQALGDLLLFACFEVGKGDQLIPKNGKMTFVFFRYNRAVAEKLIEKRGFYFRTGLEYLDSIGPLGEGAVN
jgi:hypothetical protein